MSLLPKREKSYPCCGRLIVLDSLSHANPTANLLASENYSQLIAINFPSMPDVIELARRADYAVSSPYGFPDGIHIYKGTAPQEIPFNFKLHALDKEFCPDGAKTLLQVAALLQSLVVPFGPANLDVSWGLEEVPAGEERSKLQGANDGFRSYYSSVEQVLPPATCYLELIRTEQDAVGIACLGYVRDVRVRLLGPYRRGLGVSQNLPTAGEFEFTFMVHPGHRNNFRTDGRTGALREQQSYANTTKDLLFNTVGLLANPSSYTGFSPNEGFNGHGAGGEW